MEISNQSINQLIFCAKKIKDFGIISPIFKNENIYKIIKYLTKKKELNQNFSKNLIL